MERGGGLTMSRQQHFKRQPIENNDRMIAGFQSARQAVCGASGKSSVEIVLVAWPHTLLETHSVDRCGKTSAVRHIRKSGDIRPTPTPAWPTGPAEASCPSAGSGP